MSCRNVSNRSAGRNMRRQIVFSPTLRTACQRRLSAFPRSLGKQPGLDLDEVRRVRPTDRINEFGPEASRVRICWRSHEAPSPAIRDTWCRCIVASTAWHEAVQSVPKLRSASPVVGGVPLWERSRVARSRVLDLPLRDPRHSRDLGDCRNCDADTATVEPTWPP